MRLWSLHPRYLDPKGLVALWREGLLAQAVLAGQTRAPSWLAQLEAVDEPESHPLFRVIAGDIAEWEVVAARQVAPHIPKTERAS